MLHIVWLGTLAYGMNLALKVMNFIYKWCLTIKFKALYEALYATPE